MCFYKVCFVHSSVQERTLVSSCSFIIPFFPLPQVHFVPEGGTVAQIVYSDDQDRPPQQVVYTADGTSYTSVDTSEHTLVYIHPVEATQASDPLHRGFCLLLASATNYVVQDRGQLLAKLCECLIALSCA